MIDVLVVGGIFREVIIDASGTRARIGGSGFTAAIAASRLGAGTALLGFVGNDDADETLTALRNAGVATDWVVVQPGSSGIFVFEDPRDLASPRPLYRPAESPPVGSPPRLPPHRVKVVFGVPDFDPVREGWLTGEPGETLVWDRQGWLSRARDSWAAAQLPEPSKVHLCNVAEMLDETGAKSVADALALMPPEGFDQAIIKAGAWGVTCIDRSGARRALGAHDVPAVSAIGTGDVFAGALAARIALGEGVVESARAASAAAAVAVSTAGAALPADARSQIDNLLISGPGVYVSPETVACTAIGVSTPHSTASRLMRREIELMIGHLGLRLVAPMHADVVVVYGPETEHGAARAAEPINDAALVLPAAAGEPAEPSTVIADLRERLVRAIRESGSVPSH